MGGSGAAALDAEGWFHTGDLGRWADASDGDDDDDDEGGGGGGKGRGPRRRLQVIDRVGFAVKLANGEFLTPQHAEAVYEATCASVDRCVLIARAGDVAATAVVLLREGAPARVVVGGGDELLMGELRAAAASAQLRSWEVPGRVVVDGGPWDETNGCCSAHGKVRRAAIAARHGLLAGGGGADAGGHDGSAAGEGGTERAAAAANDDEATLKALVAFLSSPSDAAAAAVLPASAVAVDGADWFGALGGDSIAATELIGRWEQHEHQAARQQQQQQQQLQRGDGAATLSAMAGLTVGDVFAMGPWQLRRKAQARLGCAAGRATTVTTAAASSDESDGLFCRSAEFWERECAAAAPSAPHHDMPPTPEPDGADAEGDDGPCVLLTGATGFLGPPLLRALLARWSTVAVLARRPIDRVHDAAEAAAAAVEATGGGSGGSGGSGCVRPRVRVFEADLARRGLGLSAEDRAVLARMRIAAVVHSAAAVDHARPYEALRATNVGAIRGLIEVLSMVSSSSSPLSSSPRPPPTFVFVSTMSVIPAASAAAAVGWTQAKVDAADGLVPPTCAAALESGYAQSKLVAEHQLAAAASRGEVRLVIARLGLIGSPAPPQREAAAGDEGDDDGVGGVDDLGLRRDWLSLLLCAVRQTGASPAGLTSGQRSVAVLPVNVAASALVTLAQPTKQLVRVLHLDAAHFGVAARPLAALLDEVETARGAVAPPLRRELPYHAWRRLVAAAGPPASLALAMLPPPGGGGELRLPSGARRRLREISRAQT